MKNITTTGRVIFAIPFLVFGLFHFMNASAMASIVPNFFPGPGSIWVYLSGLVLILGGLGVLLNKRVKESGYALAGLMAVFVATIHLPGLGSPETMQMAMGNVLKDTIILGAALYIANKSQSSCVCGTCATCKSNMQQHGKSVGDRVGS